MGRPPKYEIGATLATPGGAVGRVEGVFAGAERAVQMVRCWQCDRQEETIGVGPEFALETGYVYLLGLPDRMIGFVTEDQARPAVAIPEALMGRRVSELYQQEGRQVRLGRRRTRGPKPVLPTVPPELGKGRITPRQLDALRGVESCGDGGAGSVRALCSVLGKVSTYGVQSIVADLTKRGLLLRGYPGIRLTPLGRKVIECQPSGSAKTQLRPPPASDPRDGRRAPTSPAASTSPHDCTTSSD